MTTVDRSLGKPNRGIAPVVRLAALGMAFAVVGWPTPEPVYGQTIQPAPVAGDLSHTPNVVENPEFVLVSKKKVERSLKDYIAKAPAGELIPVIVILENQLPADYTAKVFAEIRDGSRETRKRRRREFLVNELRRIHQEQNPIITFLRPPIATVLRARTPKQVDHIRRLWIVNAVGFSATSEKLRALEEELEENLEMSRLVRSIHFDPPRAVRAQIKIAPNLSKIGADAVWNKRPIGYDGSGVVVAVVDSGVNYQHEDLASRMWINAAEDVNQDGEFTSSDNDNDDGDGNDYFDDVLGWDFEKGENDPKDETGTGHGTHVAGIVVGDGSGGVLKTGVAPGARIMALRDGNEFANQQSAFEAFQYALGKERGAEETEGTGPYYVADIVNYSSGFSDDDSESAPLYDQWRRVVQNMMDAGVLFVTSAHNDHRSRDSNDSSGEPDDGAAEKPCNVRTPGRVPFALTVGATDADDKIAWFSNRGPVTWKGLSDHLDYPWPPGLLKPDVAAPGVFVYSAANLSDNPKFLRTMDGTSMAAPHAAGVAALLLDKDPGLSAYELKYLLEETAVDLVAPDPADLQDCSDNRFSCGCAAPDDGQKSKESQIGGDGPDNVFGWGRIDALAAVKMSIPRTPYDLSVKGTAPASMNGDLWVDNDHNGSPDTPILGSENLLYARVKNLGGQVVGRVELRFYVKEIATGVEPNCGGDPGEDSNIGSYVVPLLGPVGSKHDTADGFVRWKIPDLASKHVCVTVSAGAGARPDWRADQDFSNNWAFRDFSNFAHGAGTAEPPFSCRDSAPSGGG